MSRAPFQMTVSSLVGHGFSSLLRPPFRTLWLVSLMVAAASPSIGAKVDDLALATTLLFALLTFLLDMATVLAAATEEPSPSADGWIRAALRRRCFWRFVLAGIVTDLAVGAGILLLVVGAVVIAGIVGLAPQAAVLERLLPIQALARSAELTRLHRGLIATVYSLLVLIPTLLAVVPIVIGKEPAAALQTVFGIVTATISLAAWIALTRAFTELGGGAITSLEQAAERPKARTPESS